MMFQKKIDRAMDWLKDKNKDKEKRQYDDYMEDDYIELEKGDRLAMFISAVLVFGPVFLILIGLLLLTFNY